MKTFSFFIALIFFLLVFPFFIVRKSIQDKFPTAQNNAILFVIITIIVTPIILVLLLVVSAGKLFDNYSFLHLAAASKPETHPEHLRELSKSFNPLIHRAVAGNPNTPPDVLMDLGQKFPRRMMRNPVFSLMLLSDPDLLKIMPKQTLKSLLNLKDVPLGYLEQAALIPNIGVDIARIIAKHPHASINALEQISIFHGNDETVGRSLIKRTHLSQMILEQLATQGHEAVQISLTQRKNVPIYVLKKLASCRNQAVLYFLAQQSQLPKEVQLLLAKQSKQVLSTIAVLGHHDVKLYLAREPNTPVEILEQLAASFHPDIRSFVALNSNVPWSVLQHLAADRNLEVRQTALQKLRKREVG